MEVISKNISEVIPLEHNVRMHPAKQIEALKKSFQQFGQTRAIVIDENNNILIGNGLYKALAELGEKQISCIVKPGLTEVQKKKLVLSDNKTFELGVADYEEISNYIEEITNAGDFDVAGYDVDLLKTLTQTEEENDSLIEQMGKVYQDKYTQPTAHPTPQEEQYTDSNSENPDVLQSNIQEESEPIKSVKPETANFEPAPIKRNVICPNCGEVIYLD